MKKNNILYLLLISFCMACFQSCNVEAEFMTEVPENPVMKPILSFKATDMVENETFEGIVDEAKKVIKLQVEAWTQLDKMKVNVEIPKRATLVEPASAESEMDLSKTASIVVNNRKEDVTYTIEVNRNSPCVKDPIEKVIAKVGDDEIIGEINHKNQSVILNFSPFTDISHVNVTIEVKKHVTLITPAEAESVMDFTTEKTKDIVINDYEKEVTYQLKVTQLNVKLVDHTMMKGYRLDNDGNNVDASCGGSNVNALFDDQYMHAPDAYGMMGWKPQYACQPNGTDDNVFITFNAGKKVEPAKFSAHRYWTEAGTQVTKFELYAYFNDGTPDKSGNMDGWTLIGSYDYFTAPKVNFEDGDIIKITPSGKKAQYYRFKGTENWLIHTGATSDWRYRVYSLNEFRLWEYTE